MEDYIYQLHQYLPLEFEDEQTQEFIDYLSDAYLENVRNQKYQFAFTAFHMLYMTYMYKTKWFLNGQGNRKIKDAIDAMCKQFKVNEINQLFDFSQFAEKTTIDKLLSALSFHATDISLCKNHVEIRNSCAHAVGKVQFKRVTQIENYINEELDKITEIQNKLKPEFKKVFETYINEHWHENLIRNDISIWFKNNFFSKEDLYMLASSKINIKKCPSNTRELILKKVLYLNILSEIDKLCGTEPSFFIENLQIFMTDLVDEVEYSSSPEDELKMKSTQKIIEEKILPLLVDLSSDDVEKAQEILQLKDVIN